MAKKKSSKKHQFKYAAPLSGPATPLGVTSNGVVAPVVGTARAAAQVSTHDFSYVNRDLRRISILASSLVLFEIILWYVFGHTGLGTTVYSWFQV